MSSKIERIEELEGLGSPRNDTEKPSGGGFFTVYALTINYIFGAGVLGVPYAMAHAGVVVSSLFLIFISSMSCIAMLWLVEVCARGEAWVAGGAAKTVDPSVDWSNTQASFHTSFTADEASNQRASMISDVVDEKASMEPYEVTKRRFEVGELTAMFLGSNWRRAFDWSVTLFSIVSMWFYAVLFALSMADDFPLHFVAPDGCDFSGGDIWKTPAACRSVYWLYLTLFVALMLFMTTMDLSGQAWLQRSLTITAFVCVSIMVITVVVSMVTTPGGHMVEDVANYEKAPMLFDIKGFGLAFPTFVFAQLCHHAVPGLVQLIDDKKACHRVFVCALSTTSSVYLVLGVLCACFFGKAAGSHGINKVITLNWADYTEGSSIYYNVVSYVVRMYPVVSVTAAFPLYANTLGSTWELMLPTKMQGGNKVKVLMRWASIAPCIIGAALLTDASTIISVGGLFGFIIEMVAPAGLSIVSKRRCKEMYGGTGRTAYEWHFSHDGYAYAVLAFAFCAFIFCLINLIHPVG